MLFFALAPTADAVSQKNWDMWPIIPRDWQAVGFYSTSTFFQTKVKVLVFFFPIYAWIRIL